MKTTIQFLMTTVFSVLVFTVFFATTAFADEAVSAESNFDFTRPPEIETFRHNGVVYSDITPFNPSCNISRELIDTRIGASLRRRNLKDTGYDVIDLRSAYGMNNEQINDFYKEVGRYFGVSVDPMAATEFPTTYHFNEYIYREAFKLCPEEQ